MKNAKLNLMGKKFSAARIGRPVVFGLAVLLLSSGLALADDHQDRADTRTVEKDDGTVVTYRYDVDANGNVTKTRVIETVDGERFTSRNRLDSDGEAKKARGKEADGHHARAQGINREDGSKDRKVGASPEDGDRYRSRAQARANGDQLRGKGGIDANGNQLRKRAARNDAIDARAKGRSKDGVKKSRKGRRGRPKGRTGQG